MNSFKNSILKQLVVPCACNWTLPWLLRWPFLFKSLSFFGFSPQWINLINQCVCKPNGSILINRSPCGFFGSNYGLRQGDPLFPYLFIMVEEILSLHIQNLMSKKLISPISIVHGTQGQKKRLLSLKDVLHKYQRGSGEPSTFS